MRGEAEWLDRARRGDERAFRALYEAHVERVYRLAYRFAGEEELARECAQETFVRAFHRLEQFRGEAAFGTWLHSIAVSVTMNHVSSASRRRSREAPLDHPMALKAAATNGAESRPLLRERLKRAVEGLPEIYRTVFVLHDLEGFTHEEIATMLEVAVGTSKARLSRARRRLRRALGDLAEEYVR